jgi:hypothetical protein
VCCVLWIRRNMLVTVRVRMWPGNLGRWEVRNFMCRNWTVSIRYGHPGHRHWWNRREW